MGAYYNPGNHGFQRALNSKIYVDKTSLLEYTNSVLDSEQAYICVSRPRRFGKSITAEMLVAYYDKTCDSDKMFEGLKIAQSSDYKQHLNQYDIIHLDIAALLQITDKETGVKITAEKTVQYMQKVVIEELRQAFPELVKNDEVDLPTVLGNIHLHTGIMFIVIIDEWDAIFREDKLDIKAQQAYISLLRGMFKSVASKKFLKLAYLTGILPIKKYGTESALNNFDEFTMIGADVLAEYVGFTEEEVRDLYNKYDMDFAQAKRWYDGYHLTENLHIYNPKSVVDSIRRKRIASYWTSTSSYETIKDYIVMNFDGLKDAIVEMLAGGCCKIDPTSFENDLVSFKSRDDVLTVLVHLGYLAYDIDNQEVCIPNEEVRCAFVNAIKITGWDYVIQAITASDDLLKATWQKDEEAVAKAIDAVHEANTSVVKYNDENSLSCVISLAYYNAINEYRVIRELPTGKGYADVVFLPRKHSDKPAMIVELKWDKSAEGAIGQIKERQYTTALQDYQGNMLLVGINYDKKTKKHECKIEEVKKQ